MSGAPSTAQNFTALNCLNGELLRVKKHIPKMYAKDLSFSVDEVLSICTRWMGKKKPKRNKNKDRQISSVMISLVPRLHESENISGI